MAFSWEHHRESAAWFTHVTSAKDVRGIAEDTHSITFKIMLTWLSSVDWANITNSSPEVHTGAEQIKQDRQTHLFESNVGSSKSTWTPLSPISIYCLTVLHMHKKQRIFQPGLLPKKLTLIPPVLLKAITGYVLCQCLQDLGSQCLSRASWRKRKQIRCDIMGWSRWCQ